MAAAAAGEAAVDAAAPLLLLPMVFEPPEPVDVSEMLEPEEKGGRERSEGDGDGGCFLSCDATPPRISRLERGDTRLMLLMVEMEDAASESARDKVDPPRRRRGLNFGSSLKGTIAKEKGIVKSCHGAINIQQAFMCVREFGISDTQETWRIFEK